MPKKPNEFYLEPNWHLDFRDIANLPEDRVVRVRFLVNICAGALAVILLTVVGWQVLVRRGIAAQLRFWDEKIAAHQHEYDELQVVLRTYMTAAGKIDDAYGIIHARFVPTEFILAIGRTLPDRMTVDSIAYADRTVSIRGSIAEPPERASRVLGRYIEVLRTDPQIRSLFKDISAPSLDRSKQDNLFNFEIVLSFPASTAP